MVSNGIAHLDEVHFMQRELGGSRLYGEVPEREGHVTDDAAPASPACVSDAHAQRVVGQLSRCHLYSRIYYSLLP
jgi:hypothetical protein